MKRRNGIPPVGEDTEKNHRMKRRWQGKNLVSDGDERGRWGVLTNSFLALTSVRSGLSLTMLSFFLLMRAVDRGCELWTYYEDRIFVARHPFGRQFLLGKVELLLEPFVHFVSKHNALK